MPLDEEDSDDEEEEAEEEEGPLSTEEPHATAEQDFDDAVVGQIFVKLLDGKTIALDGITTKTQLFDIINLIQ